MILPFSTQLNGKPTYFVEKILKGLYEYYSQDPNHLLPNSNSYNWLKVISDCLYEAGKKLGYEYAEDILRKQDEVLPKLHTIREDKNMRWLPGTMIDFFINTRKPNMFRFAPRIPVVDIQEVFMTYYCNDIIEISVDGTYINDIKEFALNDGFDTWSDFFNYFYPIIESNKDKCFKGKIIHWTDKRY